jgi:phosphate transport system protein
MRSNAHLEHFDRLTGLLAGMSRTVVTAIRHASTALLEADRDAADVVTAQREVISSLRREIDAAVPVLLARQQPVASDLRLVLAAVRMNADMARMGALSGHIAKVAVSRYPASAVPAQARPLLTAMADAAAVLAEKSSTVLATRDPIDAMQMGLDDDVPDALLRQLFLVLTGDWRHGTQAAVDVAMVGRFYERFADHAVSVGRQVAYFVTGNVTSGRL